MDPSSRVTILYRDIRTYGLREDYYFKARKLGVLFVRFEPDRKPEVSVDGGRLRVSVFDFLANRELTLSPDLLVLSTGLRPHPLAEKVGKQYKLTRNPDGYFLEAHVKLRPVDFPSEGIYVAGLAHAPKNLDETISQALAAAGRSGVLLSHDRLSVSGIIAKHDRDICMSCLACFRVCPFGSPFIDADGKVSHNEVICTGCGVCAGICPAKAFQVNSFRDEQIFAMIDAATETSAEKA
jgi:heterodisulfide reductase subunit A